MTENHQKALLSSLESQRNAALNGLAHSQADLAVAKEAITVLQAQLKEFTSKIEELQAKLDATEATA